MLRLPAVGAEESRAEAGTLWVQRRAELRQGRQVTRSQVPAHIEPDTQLLSEPQNGSETVSNSASCRISILSSSSSSSFEIRVAGSAAKVVGLNLLL